MKKFALSLICLSALSTFLFATPLIEAVLKHDINSVKSLLKQGVDKNVKDDKGFNALNYAISHKYSQIAQILYSNNLNNFIFLKQNGKPLYVSFSRSGFKLKNSKLDKQIIVLGTITPESLEEVCQSYERAKEQSIILPKKKFELFLSITQLEGLTNIITTNKECKKFTTILYPNYKFYQLLAKLFKYQGAPQFLFRDKKGKLTGGSIESYIFEENSSFTHLIK